MLRMIVVDDERSIRETITTFIDWESLGIQIVAKCKNGIEAYDAIIDEYPDIVLTDIRMQGLSGLALIEKLNQTHEHIHFIILSGYGTFEYAKQAMQYGVKHYLLKPCNEQQIIAAVNDIKNECVKSKEHKLPRFFEQNLFRGLLMDGLQMTNSTLDLPLVYTFYTDFAAASYDIHYFYFWEESLLEEGRALIDRYMKDNYSQALYHVLYVKNTMLLVTKDLKVSLSGLSSVLRRLSLSSGCVRIVHEQAGFSNIKELYAVLIKKLKRYDKIYYLDENGKVSIYNYNSCLNEVRKQIRQFYQQKRDLDNLKQFFKELFASIQDREFLLYLLTDIIINQNQYLPEPAFTYLENFVNDDNSMGEIVSRFFDKFDILFPSVVNSNYKPFIEKLLMYMEEHISDPNLSLKWLANNYLYMNVNYVSKQFYQQTGQKFSEYLNKLRIKKAKVLLINCSTEKIYIVAEQVGCGNNPRYFSQLFKKYTGMTPSEYMNQ